MYSKKDRVDILDYATREALPRLKAYFGKVRTGSSVDISTNFYADKSTTEILNNWDSHLKKIEKEWPGLYAFEKDLGAKVGPMSIMKPLSERLDDIELYYSSITKKSTPIDQDALEQSAEWFGADGKLTVRNALETYNLMKKSTNSGLPYFTKRRAVGKRALPLYVNKDHVIDRAGNNVKPAAILGWRGQEGGPKPEDVKQRVIWMFPMTVNISELQVYQPLIEECQRRLTVPAWVSMEMVDYNITKMFDTKGKDDLVICTDFSKFDQHFNRDMQNGAYYILERMFDNSIKDWLYNVFPIKYSIPMMYDFGLIREGWHGMASGSGGTNADETLVHRALQYEAAGRHGAELNEYSQCLGDDGCLTYPGITVEDVVESYSSHGQEMNLSKQYVSTDDCIYLRRYHHKDYRVNDICVGIYSTNRALGRLKKMERYYDDWSATDVAMRQISILQNVEYHPLREEFARYCMKGDKYRLGIDIPGFLDNIESIAKAAIDRMPDFLGYTKSLGTQDPAAGIGNWWIVQFLKSQR
nr:MAG: RNA-dependent RNA polymerase [Porcine picobirnavirus]